MINLDEAQKKTVSAWIAEGLKLSDIQTRLNSELGLRLTYMEVRLLVDDLKLIPKDTEPAKPADLAQAKQPSSPAGKPPLEGAKGPLPADRTSPPVPGRVSVTVDGIARPGTVASGSVSFSDGKGAEWYLDELGRLGLIPRQEGYRPSQQDVLAFQTELQNELARLGL